MTETKRQEDAEVSIERLRLELHRHALDLSQQVTRTALYGTLTASICGFVFVAVLFLIDTFWGKGILSGRNLVWLVGVVAAAIVVWGSFIYNKSLDIAVKWGGTKFDMRSKGVRKPDRDA